MSHLRKVSLTIDLAKGIATNITGGFSEFERFLGGSDLDTLVGPESNNTWNITDTDEGGVNGAVAFSSFENLTGSVNFADDFVISDTKGVSGAIDGGGVSGTDTLDYSLYSTVVSVTVHGSIGII
jgi:hypothetical protein